MHENWICTLFNIVHKKLYKKNISICPISFFFFLSYILLSIPFFTDQAFTSLSESHFSILFLKKKKKKLSFFYGCQSGTDPG